MLEAGIGIGMGLENGQELRAANSEILSFSSFEKL